MIDVSEHFTDATRSTIAVGIDATEPTNENAGSRYGLVAPVARSETDAVVASRRQLTAHISPVESSAWVRQEDPGR